MSKTRKDGVCLRASTPISNPKETCTSFENLYKAMRVSKKNIMWKDSTAGFVKNGISNCHKLSKSLNDGTYKLSEYSIFEVHEKKTRTIVSTRIKDRVVQHSLCDNYLYDQLTKGFIYDNGACLKGKGTDFCRNRLKCHLERHYRKYSTNGYVLKVDIHDYFGSTLHSVAKETVARRVPDEWARGIVFDVIDSFNNTSPDRGMGLGSQITQLVQLAVLDDLDHEIKERLKIKGYVRYMDDFILIHESRVHLEYCLSVIRTRLDELSLTLNENKTSIQPISHGINFLGFTYRLTKSGKVIMRLQKGKSSKERRKLKKLSKMVDKDSFNACYQSWRSFAEKGNSYRLLSDMDEYYRQLLKDYEQKH